MKKLLTICSCFLCLLIILAGCNKNATPKIGVAFGVGSATRWQLEKKYMEEYAKQLGAIIEVRLNTDEKSKPLAKDCYELIDSGIDVLIIRPRDIWGMKDVVDYAQKKKVKIISYDSLIEGQPVDLFVGYDSKHAGELLGRYLSELVVKGDYILLWGDKNRNVEDMYDGVMNFLSPHKESIHIILEAEVPGWSTVEAKKIIKKAIIANGNKVDAILAFNDSLAGAAAEVIAELGIKKPVAITGMDAQLDAVKRIVNGTQSCTAYMDLQALAKATIDEAINLSQGKPLKTNTEIDNGSDSNIPCYFLTRELVIKQNIERVLIESGYYTHDEVFNK